MNEIVEAAKWRGKPTSQRIRLIAMLTETDQEGRRYWRPDFYQGWRQLKTPLDFERLNVALDRLS